MQNKQKYSGLEVAIIGMACRFPGAPNWRKYWENLVQGVESIHFFSKEELAARGLDEKKMNHPGFVNAGTLLDGKECFDSSFFDYRPIEAKLMNPSHRIFHECVWEALDDAGYSSGYNGNIGLYAGANEDLNWRNFSMLENKNQEIDDITLSYLNNKDYLAALLSYKLNLRGPSFSINTLCSTSLVAVHVACESLLLGETNIALAGGVTVRTNKQQGYFYQEGMINSNDGHCRAFDKSASGAVSGEGAGVVVLKRLQDAIKDNDHIYAIIKGSAINNDGNRKVGFTAPGVDGQVACIKKALLFSRVDPGTISYVETHGTGTHLGDPIEVEALNIAFNNKGHSCAIGSVKTNIGHLDVAAGIAGLIKTALSLKYKKIPPSLHFREPNPAINFDDGPFYVNATLKDWESPGEFPLRAGVSSFGIGGTNAHAILEEWPLQESGNNGRKYKLLTISAKTERSLIRYMSDVADFLIKEPLTNLFDMSYTLQTGRRHFSYRKAILYKDIDDLLLSLNAGIQNTQIIKSKEGVNTAIFMFPGQASQYVNMAKGLYASEPLFRKEMDKGFSLIERLTGERMQDVLYPSGETHHSITETKYAQPLIFLLEYSLAQVLIAYGISPKYMIGHSIGEYTAACLSGVFGFEDAVKLVVKRGELMNSLPAGAMVSVSMSREEAAPYLDDEISIAAINAPEQLVLSGNLSAMARLTTKLDHSKIPYVRLQTSHAFHSEMQDAIAGAFKEVLSYIDFGTIKYPFISNVTGDFIKEEEACSPEYWIMHLRRTVRFADGLKTLLSKSKDAVFVEVGAGRSLSGFLKQQTSDQSVAVPLNLVRSVNEREDDEKYFTDKIGKLWAHGLNINWSNYYSHEERRKVSLPAYAFERVYYPAEVDVTELLSLNGRSYGVNKSRNIKDWFYRIQWKRSYWLNTAGLTFNGNSEVCIFSDNYGLAETLIEDLKKRNVGYIVVNAGNEYEKKTNRLYVVDPFREKDIQQVFAELSAAKIVPSHIIHLWCFTGHEHNEQDEALLHHELGYESLLGIAHGLSDYFSGGSIQLDVIANGLYRVLDNENTCPSKSTLLAAIKVIPQEFQNVISRAIDIPDASDESVTALQKELMCSPDNNEVAIRGKARFVKGFEQITVKIPENKTAFKNNGTYLITGASGGMGKLFAGFLADKYQANLMLISRSQLPADWIQYLETKGSKVKCISADVASVDQLMTGVLEAEKIVGNINGVIHTAGVADFAGIILKRNREDDEKVFVPKIYGTQVLDLICKDKKLDFFVNCSSQAASLAPFGQVAYVAANLFQDAFAEWRHSIYPVISIEWTALQEVGMAVRSVGHLNAAEQEIALQHGISPAEAVSVLENALLINLPVQIISTQDFQHVFNSGKEALSDYNIDEDQLFTGLSRERPELSAAYVSPQTVTEGKLVELVQQFFGIQNIGIADNFFELGGDSLKAMVFLKRIKKEFNIDVSLKEFFEDPTIRHTAFCIDETYALLKKQDGTSKKMIRI